MIGRAWEKCTAAICFVNICVAPILNVDAFTVGESPLCVVKRAHPTDLDLSNVQSDTSGLSQNAEMDEESTPLSPGAKLPEV